MQIAVPVLLVIILSIVIVMIVLIIFQGETNRKVEKLNKQIRRLNKHLSRSQKDKQKQITRKYHIGRSYRHSLNSEYKSLQTDLQQSNIRSQIKKQKKFPAKVKSIYTKIYESGYISERFFGESIINKIGMIVFALGMALFVKYAIESSWINNIGRVGIGIFIGGILSVLAHLTHKNYRAFSSVLLGGGMAVLYYTTAIAFDEYHIISELTAFFIIFAITGFTVSLSIAYNRIELALFATIAALTAPLLVGFTTDSYVTLFSYLLIINIGILTLVFFKKWLILNIISFYSTLAFISAWFLMLYFKEKPIPQLEAFIFLSIYYIVFFVMHIINNVKKHQKFIPIQLSLISILNIMYFTGGIVIIRNWYPNFDGLFTASMGLVNFLFFLILYKRSNLDVNLLNLLLGLVILFAALVPPVQMVGKTITLVWSIQMILLLWVSTKIDFNMMKLSSLGLLLAMLVSLGFDLWKIYVNASVLSSPLPLFINKGFIISFIASISLGLYSYLLIKNKAVKFVFIPTKLLSSIVGGLMIITLYFTFLLEIRYQITQHVLYSKSITIYLGIYNFAFLALACLPAIFVQRKQLNMLSWIVGFIAFFVYLFFYHGVFIDVRDSYILQLGAKYNAYFSHFIIIGILLIISFISLRSAIVCRQIKSKMAFFSLWATIFIVLFVFSSELDHIYVMKNFKNGFVISDYILKAHALPYTLLWGGFAFFLISLGMLIHFKGLRNISLLLFFGTILKMFVFDINRISKNEQIIEFLFIGIVLLLASFMYHKSKFSKQRSSDFS